jgi:hypothetical protein
MAKLPLNPVTIENQPISVLIGGQPISTHEILVPIEYRLVAMTEIDTEAKLNAFGAQGWQLIGYFPFNAAAYSVIFSRQKQSKKKA